MATGGSELSVYDRIDNPVAAMEFLGNAIAESGIFGCSNKQQGIVLAWECLASRTSALTLAKENHIISNKLSMKADAMMATFNERGGKHEVIERTPDKCVIEFISNTGKKYLMALTWEQAQEEAFPYYNKGKSEDDIIDEIIAWKAGKIPQPRLKAKYRTPRSRMQMLSARLASDSVRAIDPSVNFGRYAPEELDGDETAGENGHAATAERKPRKTAKQVVEEAAGHVNVVAGEVVDASFEIVVPPATSSEESQFASHAQAEQIRNLFQVLGADADAQTEILRKRSANSIRNLTRIQAEYLLSKLQDAAKAAATKVETAGAAGTQYVDGPCTADQVSTIKSLIAEVEQVQPGTTEKVKAKLIAAGLQKIVDLTCREAETLEQALRLKNISAFIESKLAGFKPGN